tara:strand:- start:37 stop:255 length:219 start_codon:yes stop_codon:yes gene_type:complete
MIKIWSKPNCIFCDKAVNLCKLKNLEFEKLMIDVDYTREELIENFPNARTFPQITMDGEYIGGFTELDAHLS